MDAIIHGEKPLRTQRSLSFALSAVSVERLYPADFKARGVSLIGRTQEQHEFACCCAGPQHAPAFWFSFTSQRSRDLQLAGRGIRSTCTSPLCRAVVAAR